MYFNIGMFHVSISRKNICLIIYYDYIYSDKNNNYNNDIISLQIVIYSFIGYQIKFQGKSYDISIAAIDKILFNRYTV